jgi:hypothetical protein
VTYVLAGSSTGYDLTNIVVYGGWGDNGRDQQAYTVYYSTVTAPGSFTSLATVNDNPAIAGGLPSATRVSIARSTGVLASNVAALKFDFSAPASENGFCGYAEITVFGNPSAPTLAAPTITTNTQPALASMVVGDAMTFRAAFASSLPMTFQWQKISGGATNDLPGETHATLTLKPLQPADTAAYRLVAANDLGTAASSPAVLAVNPVPAAINNLITCADNQAGWGGDTFYPSWTMDTNGSLIAGKSPAVATGDFSLEMAGRDVNALTATHDLGLTQISGSPGYPITTTPNYVTCGNGGGAGSALVYNLPAASNGYDLTNITVYGGWSDNGRDQQACTVYYSPTGAPTNFVPLSAINFNPSVGGGIQSATRVTLWPASGALATNVAAVKFDFTNPTSENGYCGYAGLAIRGSPHVPPAVPARVSAELRSSGEWLMNMGNLVAGRNYEVQSATNLAAPVWVTETSFVAAVASVVITNSTAGPAQRFYRVRCD